jgi:hypothetical protein
MLVIASWLVITAYSHRIVSAITTGSRSGGPGALYRTSGNVVWCSRCPVAVIGLWTEYVWVLSWKDP